MNPKSLSFLCALLLLSASAAFAQSPGKSENEPKAILELGAAASRSLTEGQSSFGPAIAVEVEPIEHWLEIEAGLTPLFARHSTEWSLDVLLKKPWTLSRKAEFMFGAGPEWIHSTKSGKTTNAVGLEVAADFMFWPGEKRRFGWYLEPAYEYKFGGSREHSIGITGGLLIAIR